MEDYIETAPIKKKTCFQKDITLRPGETAVSWAISNPFYFGVLRAVLGIYVLCIMGYGMYVQHVIDTPNGVKGNPWWTWWIYNTNWTWNMLGVYFICSSIQSFRENSRLKSNTFTYAKQSSSWWEYYVWVTFELSWTACLFVSANFWIFIMGVGCKASPKDCPPMTIYSWNAHLVNFILINIDLVLNRFQFKPLHFIFPAIYACVWLIFSGIWKAITGFWIYPIQKPETGWIAYAFYPGFIVLYIGIFFLGMLLESGLSRLISSKRVMEPTVFKEYETI